MSIPQHTSPCSQAFRLADLIVLMTMTLFGFAKAGQTDTLRLEFQPSYHGESLLLNYPISRGDLPAVSMVRMDLLLSRLALKRADGSWLESADWFAFVSASQARLTADADGIPAEDFTAIRFDIGLPDAIDKADPAQWPPGHALHPELNAMHWGWLGGYVFVALEGHAGGQGFSYHLAGAEARHTVELPVKFKGGGPRTIGVQIDLARWLAELDMVDGRQSTHSRPGDELAAQLNRLTAKAFSITGMNADTFYQSTIATAEKIPTGTKAYPIQITQRFAAPALPVDNPLTVEGVDLGRSLFHETRLSKLQNQSCASCHQQNLALAEDKPVSIGGEGQRGKRNAMALFNLAWHKAFFWDGRAKTLRQQVLMPIQDKHEMNAPLDLVISRLQADDEYPAEFAKAFGSRSIDAERIAKALEQFLLTQISQDSKFDRAVRKEAELSSQEKRGLELFITEHDPKRGLYGADCFHCHGGVQFTNHNFANNGLDLLSSDVGVAAVSGLPSDHGKFKTPSLRNIALTAPYMHDGRFTTLEEVVRHYSEGVKRSPTLDPNLAKHPASGIQLNADDQAALVAFLKTLTDETLATSPSPSLATTR